MGKVKNTFGQDRELGGVVPRLVLAGQVIEVPDEQVYAYTQQAGWTAADDDTQALHETAAVVAVAAQIVADAVPIAEPEPDAPREVWGGYIVASDLASVEDLSGMTRDQIRDAYTAPTAEPAGSASRSAWLEWVVGTGLAAPDDVDGLTRDQLRDTYKSAPPEPVAAGTVADPIVVNENGPLDTPADPAPVEGAQPVVTPDTPYADDSPVAGDNSTTVKEN